MTLEWCKVIQPETLKLTKPANRLGVWTLIFIFSFLLSGELILRLPVVQAVLPPPTYGSSSPSFGIKIKKLDSLVKQIGQVDCVFVGSSIVDSDLDPEIFTQAYYRQTGKTLTCFNFALLGMSPRSLPQIIRLLQARYHPPVIIYGVSPVEFTAGFNPSTDVYDTPWLHAQLGQMTTAGWLTDKSYVVRHLDSWRYFWDWIYWHEVDNVQKVTPLGYRYDRALLTAPTPPLQNIVAADYYFVPSAQVGLQRLAEGSLTASQILIFEAPLHPALLAQPTDYETYFIRPLQEQLLPLGLSLVRTQNKLSLPPDAWADPVHLNRQGADVLSAWLGQQYGLTGLKAP